MMTVPFRSSLRPTSVGAALIVLACVTAAAAQSGPPNAVQGFRQNSNEPIKIESVSLEVRDKEKVATFIDNVKVTQGDTTLECKRLIVHYTEGASPGKGKPPAKTPPATAPKKPAAPAAGGFGSGSQQISKLEAQGGVVVTQKDQTATGDRGVYDMKSNTLTLSGNVVVSQGQNVVRGDRLVVDMASGASRVESSGGTGRVQGLFIPGTTPNAPGSAPSPNGKPQGNDAERNARPRSGAQSPSRPLRLN
jgi:lipopolysaccharide export system protein LptA